MLDLPKKIIVFDTEFTAWPGSQERNWGAPGEYKEIVQIGAVKIETENFVETDSLDIFIRPQLNPILSDYFITLTGISQKTVDKNSVDFPAAIKQFSSWSQLLNLYSFGGDEEELEENCKLLKIAFPFERLRFFDVRDVFKKFGIPAEEYNSGTIVRVFGKEISRPPHNALNDARTIVDGLRELAFKAAGNK